MKVMLFGSLSEAIGREVELAFTPGLTVGDARTRLGKLYPAAAPILARPGVRACMDDVMAADDALLADGAELAFLPPLSGG